MSSWDTDSSSGLFEGTLTIEKAYFGYDAGYLSGEQELFILEGDGEGQDDQVRQFYSIGSGWDVENGGESVSGHDKFRDNSAYGRFIDAALKTDAKAVIQERGYPDQASVWEGLRFKMKRKSFDYGEQIGKKEYLVPVKFLGEAKAAKPKKKTGGSSKKLRKELVGLAKNADDFDDFLVEALDLDGLEDDADLYGQVIDEGKKGFYAKNS